jgi:hypothetical protein
MLVTGTASILRLCSGIQKGYRVRIMRYEGNFDRSAEQRGSAAVGMMVLVLWENAPLPPWLAHEKSNKVKLKHRSRKPSEKVWA